MPKIDISTGFEVAGQFPLNYKGYFKTIAEMQDLGISNAYAYKYYETMFATCVETNKQYVWREAQVGETGILVSHFTYPNGIISNGIDYSNREFNFFLYTNDVIQDNIAKVINVYEADLSGEGTLEEQIVEYINSLNYEKLETDAEIWINYVSTPVLTAFLVSTSSGNACDSPNLSPYNLTLYHDGSNTYPVIGDTIYIDEEGDTIFIDSLDKQMDNLEYLRTNSLGKKELIECR